MATAIAMFFHQLLTGTFCNPGVIVGAEKQDIKSICLARSSKDLIPPGKKGFSYRKPVFLGVAAFPVPTPGRERSQKSRVPHGEEDLTFFASETERVLLRTCETVDSERRPRATSFMVAIRKPFPPLLLWKFD